MVSIYLIIFVILITFGVLLFVKPKQKQQSTGNIVGEYNDVIKKYNELINMINTEIIKKRWTIVHANDIAAMKALNKCVENINYLSDTITNYCNRFSEAYKNNDMGGANYCLINIRENLVSLSIDLKTISNIKVLSCFTNNNSTKEQPVVKETIINTVSYFEGCKTKEEIDTRYRALAKVFHPDAKSGDETIFMNIQNEYEKLTNGGN